MSFSRSVLAGVLAGALVAPLCACAAWPLARTVKPVPAATPPATPAGPVTPAVATLGDAAPPTAGRPVDYAEIAGEVRGEGADRSAALRALSAKRQAIESGLLGLAGATGVGVQAGEIRYEKVRESTCATDDDLGRKLPAAENCVPGVVRASVKLVTAVRPASLAGDAGAVASRLGLENVVVGAPQAPAADAVAAQHAEVEAALGPIARTAGGR